MLESTPARSFFEKESAGIGLAKVEATAKARRVAKKRVNCILVIVEGLFGEEEESVFDW